MSRMDGKKTHTHTHFPEVGNLRIKLFSIRLLLTMTIHPYSFTYCIAQQSVLQTIHTHFSYLTVYLFGGASWCPIASPLYSATKKPCCLLGVAVRRASKMMSSLGFISPLGNLCGQPMLPPKPFSCSGGLAAFKFFKLAAFKFLNLCNVISFSSTKMLTVGYIRLVAARTCAAGSPAGAWRGREVNRPQAAQVPIQRRDPAGGTTGEKTYCDDQTDIQGTQIAKRLKPKSKAMRFGG